MFNKSDKSSIVDGGTISADIRQTAKGWEIRYEMMSLFLSKILFVHSIMN